jgi:hypothetical protein
VSGAAIFVTHLWLALYVGFAFAGSTREEHFAALAMITIACVIAGAIEGSAIFPSLPAARGVPDPSEAALQLLAKYFLAGLLYAALFLGSVVTEPTGVAGFVAAILGYFVLPGLVSCWLYRRRLCRRREEADRTRGRPDDLHAERVKTSAPAPLAPSAGDPGNLAPSRRNPSGVGARRPSEVRVRTPASQPASPSDLRNLAYWSLGTSLFGLFMFPLVGGVGLALAGVACFRAYRSRAHLRLVLAAATLGVLATGRMVLLFLPYVA